MLDEVEELNLVLGHYSISWGVAVPSTATQKWMEWDVRAANRPTESNACT